MRMVNNAWRIVNCEQNRAAVVALARAGRVPQRATMPALDTSLRWLLVFVMVVLTLPWPTPVFAQAAPSDYPLERCARGAFSTEEDFVMQEGEAYDGDPYVSDGDVLSLDGQVCARNQDLLVPFFTGRYIPDLGLDALDILDTEHRLVAFSTELDDPDGSFTAGDLLFTNGAIIPNFALVMHFGIDHDIGLDAVQIMGAWENVRAFANGIAGYGRGRFIENPDLLKELLAEYKVDIWFSVEQTFGPADGPIILDGDLLTATGTVIAKQNSLLGASIPAGIPIRGVDFGLDAVATERTLSRRVGLTRLRQSTEILYRAAVAFTDGDVLRLGGAVETPNEVLVNPFHPAADFLGLDALTGTQPFPEPEPMITNIGGKSVWDMAGGVVVPGDPGSGLYVPPAGQPQQPFGMFVPIDGYVPAGVYEFRVAFRKAGDPIPPPGTAAGIRTSWTVQHWTGSGCEDMMAPYTDDGSGWFKNSEYRQHRYIDGFCPDSGVILAVWDTLNDPNVTDKDGHYVIWLEWRMAPAGPAIRETMEHHVQLDNTLPDVSQIELRTLEGEEVEPCGGAGSGVHQFEVFGEIHDDYFGGYRIRVAGGNPPGNVFYGWHNWWDGSPYVANLNNQGTTPAGLQLLRPIDMNDLGASFTNCCYLLEVWASDVSIRHSFDSYHANPTTPVWPSKFLTFAAAP